MNKAFTILVIAFLLSGCAAPKLITPYYKDLEPTYDSVYKINAPLVIAVQDQRPYVLSGDKNELFYGLVRSGYGIPYSQYGGITATNDILNYIYLLINNENVNSAIQQQSIDIHADGLEEALKIRNGRALLFIQVYEWKTDMPKSLNGAIFYDLRATVFNNKGDVVARKNVKGKDKIINPDANTKSKPVSDYDTESVEMIIPTVRWYQKARADVLGKILLDSKIINVLNGDKTHQTNNRNEVEATKVKTTEVKKHPSTEEVKKSGCSTEQILMMKNSQMSDQQIRAACDEM